MFGHAGTGEKGFTDDGDDARTAKLSGPKGVACAPDGSVCIADTENNRIRMLKYGSRTLPAINHSSKLI
jgi:sugar lactone lactonase YvrE